MPQSTALVAFNRYKEKQIIFVSYFQVRNPTSGMCFDTLGKRDGAPLGLYMCHGQGGNQVRVPY